ncbi:solute carrier family 22 member 23-like isoform X1 [Acipenser oxyrinchus oxyrinchus]|uniref:Solute carrier family 22 member 23-like isoform X1 n=1 Tax=Acipenser oxyrinchus oxyrinchus TaxID=40147 RepID=A0AAD8GDW7_ACIOX|nr:solute carrier family 22 member 23-like isoform X1 [Acipenser oxyrinchus oxyrinchus]
MAVERLNSEEVHPEFPENGCVASENSSSGVLREYDESVAPYLGGFGKYQKQLILLTWIPALFIGYSQNSDSLLLAQPGYTCKSATVSLGNTTINPVSYVNTTNGSWTAYIHGNDSSNDINKTDCLCFDRKYNLSIGLVQNVVTKWNLVCDSTWKVHIAKFSLLVGLIFGYLVMGVLADWFGRQPVLIVSVFFILIFGLTVALSVNVTMFSTLRFFEGFCLAGIILTLYIMRIEMCDPGNRFMVTMVASFIALLGQLLLPGLAALCRDWQILQAVIICPFILMISFICIFPESLRWLLATQQYEKAKSLILQINKKNRVDSETDVKGIMPELERELAKKPKKTCIVKVVGTRNLWKNILVLCVNSLTGFGIHHCFARSMMKNKWENTTVSHNSDIHNMMLSNFYADYYTMAGIAVASCLAMCPAVGFMGRRGGLLMFMILTALASLLQLGFLNLIVTVDPVIGKYNLHHDTDLKETINRKFSIAFSIIGMFSSHAVGSLSIFFCAEITPTVIRGGGLGLVLASAGFGMLTAPIMELHNQKGYFLHHVIFACCTLICIICILLLPESRHQNLPETISDGEGYMRQPLLPPKKGGEQPLLLTNSELKDYSGIHETPVHLAASSDSNTDNVEKSS